jgi:surfactin synthase thioesterase subunit
MRVDLAMVEGYRYRDDAPLGCPILALGGTDDPSVLPAELEGWRDHTRHAFRAELLPGAHFFLRSNAARLHALVTEQLTSSRAALAAEG